MNKMLLTFDGTQFSEGAFEFARRVNELHPALVTGMFLPQLSYSNLWNFTGGMAGSVYVPITDDEESDLLENNIERFRDLCNHYHISCKVHKDFYDFALPVLKKESRFSDLLIVSSKMFFEESRNHSFGECIKDVLHISECPVIVIPEKFDFPKRNIIAYDGSSSSVYALKQFAYIFPELTRNETLLVYIKNGERAELPDESYLEELASQHYPHLNILKLDLNSKKHFNEWLKKEDRPILISGSFGRSSISEMLRKSFVNDIIADHKLPVFIAHL